MRPGAVAAAALAPLSFCIAAPADAQSGPGGACFWVHGRLFAANGAPTFRIWRVGTIRILGVVGAHAAGEPTLPQNLETALGPDAFQVEVLGDYHVCPLKKEHPGWMRFVRLDGARRLVVRPRRDSPR
jgi:hypothetical protein